jgi:hypothetical protein
MIGLDTIYLPIYRNLVAAKTDKLNCREQTICHGGGVIIIKGRTRAAEQLAAGTARLEALYLALHSRLGLREFTVYRTVQRRTNSVSWTYLRSIKASSVNPHESAALHVLGLTSG